MRSVVLAVAVGLLGQQARADLDVDRWIARPGVRLLIVEFSASWCKPCVESAPKWRALADRYRSDGVRFVLVTTQDAKGCLSPLVQADAQICDESGRLAELLKANPLPAAYVWSWQGKLVGNKLAYADVEREIGGWLASTPRVSVEGPPAVRDLVRAELRSTDKLIVIASKEEQARLEAIKAESLKARYDDKAQCEVGKELSANAILDARVADGRITLSLLSAERGCLVAAASAPFDAKKAHISVAEVVSALYARLTPKAELPIGGSTEPPLENKAARVVARDPGLLVVEARSPQGTDGDRLAQLNWAKKRAMKAARALALTTLAGPPYGLDEASAAAALEKAVEEFEIGEDRWVMVTMRLKP